MIFSSDIAPVHVAERLIHNVINESLLTQGDKVALIESEKGTQVTFKQLYDQSQSVASYLHQHDFAKGDLACTVLHNCLEVLPIFLGVAMQGGVLSPVSYAYGDYELTYQLKDCKPKLVFCQQTNFDKVYRALQELPKMPLIVVIANNGSKLYPKGTTAFQEVLLYPANPYRPEVQVDFYQDVVIIPYSSGTTGLPKGVMLSHCNLIHQQDVLTVCFKHRLLLNARHLIPALRSHEINYMPMYHIFGFLTTLRSLVRGATMVIMPFFDFEKLCYNIEKYQPAFLKVSPPSLVLLSKSPIVDKYDLSSIKIMMSSAATAGKELCDSVRQRLPNVEFIGQAYGMTEMTGPSHFPVYSQESHSGSSGRLIPNVEMKIVSLDGQELGLFQKGEIWLRSGALMLGYLNRSEASASSIDYEGWFHTGDIGYVDMDGELYVVDRVKELIKVDAFPVPPSELEDLLHSHPMIEDVAVVGIPDDVRGELPLAFVVRKCKQLLDYEVVDFVKGKVAYYKELSAVRFIDQIPKSPTGKILRQKLKDCLIAEQLTKQK
ncbi:hypothetical protein L596_026565 [Steinernema carpocapsae]|uniref:AMP-dependent synthetase/ligase domain-containing protein n=1 Tax=Steinernema carpocapsae TaxID=34508 RepID=A0A4U5M1R9_STECR|nr:hypothetical protein L596_026565 [Steinernema carpocapsae]